MKTYSIKNPNSSAPAEEIDQERYDALQASGRLRNYEVAEVTKPAKPAELSEKAAPKAPKADEK